MKKIKLENYRCFQELELELMPHINLLVGDNASGKTTILRAMRSAVSSFFYGYSDENTRFIGLTKEDFTEQYSDYSKVNEKPIKLSFDYSDYTNRKNKKNVSSIAFLSLKNKKSRTSVLGIKPFSRWASAVQDFLFNEETQTGALPLFANFSTGDIHKSRPRINGERFKEYKHKPSFGYYECLQGDGLFQCWIKRMLILAEGDKGELELQGVKKAIKNALGENGCNIIKDISIRPIQGKVYYQLMDGREVEAGNLSDGHARLVNIVTDLAFRCMLLNQGFYGMDACDKTYGTVLIDEIDLHLHPTLQSVVVGSLHKAFPELQFLITTHAPMVMTGIEADERNQIYYLRYIQKEGYKVERINTFGMDASTIIEVTLNEVPRAKVVQEQLSQLFQLIDDFKIDEAKQLLTIMYNKFGDNLPELSKAGTMLNIIDGTGV